MNDHIKRLNRLYRDDHGHLVRVIGWDPQAGSVIFLREEQGYKPECARPLWQFRTKFTFVRDDGNGEGQ